MALANVALTNTFDEWRTRTNQLVVQSNFYEINLPNYTYANNIGVTANAFASATISGANTAVGAGANAFASVTIAGANTAVGAGANNFAKATIAGANTAVGAGANAFASATIAGANSAVGTGANNFTKATLSGANAEARIATNLTSGTVPSARMSGSYTGITGVGTITAGVWNATDIALADGGTNASLTASAGAITYSTASALALSGVGTSGQVLTSAGTSAPTWTAQSSLSVGSATNASQLGSVAAASYARKDTAQSYSGNITVTDGAGSVVLTTSGDIYASRTGGTTGVLFLTSAGTRYLYYDGTSYQLPTAGLVVGGDITAFASDERLKKDIVEIQNPLDKLSQIRGVHYRHNDFALEQGLPDEDFVGVIAQEVEKVLPEVVTLAPFDYEGVDSSGKKISKSGKNYKTVKYEKIVPLLIEAIKELTAKVEMLESRVQK